MPADETASTFLPQMGIRSRGQEPAPHEGRNTHQGHLEDTPMQTTYYSHGNPADRSFRAVALWLSTWLGVLLLLASI